MAPRKKKDKQVTFADADYDARTAGSADTGNAAIVIDEQVTATQVPTRKRKTGQKTTRKTVQKATRGSKRVDHPEPPQQLDQNEEDDIFFNPSTPTRPRPDVGSLRQTLCTPQTPWRELSPSTPVPRGQGRRSQPVLNIDDDAMEKDIENGLDLLSFVATPRHQATGAHQTPRRQAPDSRANSRQPATPRSNIRLHPSDIALRRPDPGLMQQLGKTRHHLPQRRRSDVLMMFGPSMKMKEVEANIANFALVYSANTASCVLRKHLYMCHVEDWVDLCDQEGVDITAQEAQAAVAQYRAGAGACSAEKTAPRLAFSPEAFVDAICAFIAADSQIHASHLRQKYFSDCLRAEKMKDYQLIRDIDIRWGSTALMIDRARLLKMAIKRFLAHPEFKDLRRYYLTEVDWTMLDRYSEILAVPQRFQHVLSGEKTPTLCFVLPAFEAMIEKWKVLRDTIPQLADAIEAGIEKLTGYISRLSESKVYTLAMILNPAMKLRWLEHYHPDMVVDA
ncbi:hypothetical protein D9758_010660 [Tetrapyrgos nigripes]|uniref:Uncharacterized protein n=1 Tax=Tetrapyrgos nigripes TaxID=182062 RepID=A0A8H5LPB8_9AGAR|nr:hypothetical protein D9758_010660 [Tetrapyrgos nigripes]